MSGTPNDPNQARPWGAPPPEPNPYAAPVMPDALGAAPPPPPPPAYVASPAPQYAPPPQYPGAYMPQPGYGIPPPPPPPPGMGMPGFGIAKPHSGKTTASLVCAGVGLACCPIALPIGAVLGGMGIAETGPSGSHSGRGLAIAGLVINLLLIVGYIGVYATMFTAGAMQQQHREAENQRKIEEDFAKIRARMREYYDANRKSLGPGGPRLASPDYTKGNAPAGKSLGKVNGLLKVEDLCSHGELSLPPSMYELTVTGSASATVRAITWGRQSKTRIMKVFDISLGQFSVEDE